MTALNNIMKRAMSLMKAHVQYSQSLAVEFSHLIKDYEELVEVPEVIELDAQDSDLKRRAKYHAGNKLFECAVCGKRLGNKSKLETHTRVHTGEKPFKCLTCSKRFNQKHHLDRHTKSQHGD